MNTRMAGAGQTINDRFLAAKHSIAGQGLAKSVCKATTEEMMGPKKKHLDYLVHCTNEPNVSIPQMANLLIERSQSANWIVVYKALVTVHHLMCYGNERFTQYLASNNCTFQLSNFFDKSGVHGYDMSPFIRKYARYLNEKALSYRSIAFDFCKVKRGKEDGILRTMNAEKLLKTLPCLQSQLDMLLEFDCSANDLTNGVINMCFMLLFRDLIRLFACYNDGIINLLEKYFDMNKKQCKEGLDIYKKFLIRMDRVGEFLKVAENVGIDRGDIPDLTKAPSSLLEALEQHLNALDGKKVTSSSSTPSQSSSSTISQKNSHNNTKTAATPFNTAVTNGHPTSQTNGLDEYIKQQLLAEEEAAMNQFKSKVNSSPTTNNPFLTTAINNASSLNSVISAHEINLLDNELAISTGSSNTNNRASDDLLQLSNPFSDAFAAAVPSIPNSAIHQQNNAWLPNGPIAYSPQPVITNGTFVSDSNFAAVFGSTETNAADDSNQTSFNPFLMDDPIPPLLLDNTSPNCIETKPIQEVLDYFQKSSEVQSGNLTNHDVEDNSPQEVNSPLTIVFPNQINPITLPVSDPDDGVPVITQNSAVNSQLTGYDGLGTVLQPFAHGQVNQVQHQQPSNRTDTNQRQQSSGALLTGDLETSLASLAENLTIRSPTVKGVQWNSPKNGSKPNWTPQPLAATTGAGYKPMNQAMASPPPLIMPQSVFHTQMQPVMAGRPIITSTTLYSQRAGMMVVTPTSPIMNPMGQQQSLLFN